MTTDTTATTPDTWPTIIVAWALAMFALLFVCWIKGLG